MLEKLQPQRIHLIHATGEVGIAGQTFDARTYHQATSKLIGWKQNLKQHQVEKIDWSVEFADGFIHSGTIKLSANESPDFPGAMTSGFHLLFANDERSKQLQKFIDKDGKKAAHAYYLAARYDFGCAVEEPELADKTQLLGFMTEENSGIDVEVNDRDTLDEEFAAKFEKPWFITFADASSIETDTEEQACYLQREWRRMNNMHPVLGEGHPIVEEATQSHNLGM